MSIFNRVKKEEKLSRTQAKPTAVPQGEGLEDFHPLDTGLGQAVWELRQEYEGGREEPKSCTRDQFLALLAGVPALRKTPGIPGPAESGSDYYVTLPQCASAEDAAACRSHLKEVFGIEDKASLLEFCNRELRCQNQYLDFEGFWEDRAPFSLAALNDGPREFFESARDFSAQFYEVTRHQGFLGWDISECVGHLRVGYACGLLNREEFDEMAEHWVVQAQCFRNWAQFAVSLVCGELYWNFRQGAELPEIQENQKLWLRLVRQLLDNENAWGSGLWYTPPREKEYRLWPSELRTFLTDWKGPSGCFATDHITVLGKQVGWCYREEPDEDYPDSGWRFFSGEEDDDYVNDLSHTEVYDLNTICNYDPSILPLLSAPCGTAFMRGRDGKFHAERHTSLDRWNRMGLLNKVKKKTELNLTLKLNARFQPKHRFELEDALQEILKREQMGEVIGGGTAMNPDGEIVHCDIEIRLAKDDAASVQWLADLLNVIGIAKGSVLQGVEPEIPVGTLEGLAYYSNGVDLPEEVYRTCDINYVIEQMEQAMEGIGRLYSWRELETYTALYFYGTSFSEMKESIAPLIAEYPLCQKCRIEQIA